MNISFPNINKFNILLASNNKTIINNVAKYITEALKVRQEKIDNMHAN